MAPSPAQMGARSPTIRRILREAAEISSSPSPDFTAEPLESDLFEWHFTIRGPPQSVFSQGIYHGRITLPNTYPLRPPNFRFTTPNGRFETNREICLSISGHHEETWQPAWGIRTAIVALRSFMETDAKGQLGGLETPEATRVQLAKESRAFTCPVCAKSNVDIIKETEKSAAEADSSPREEVGVPSELNLGWKDEMGSAQAGTAPVSGTSPPSQQDLPPRVSSESTGTGAGEDDAESAQLAEGFVQTAPLAPSAAVAAPPPSAASPQTPVRPHPVGTAFQMHGRHTRQTAIRQRDDGVPAWLDRAIVALVVLLVTVVLKVMVGN